MYGTASCRRSGWGSLAMARVAILTPFGGKWLALAKETRNGITIELSGRPGLHVRIRTFQLS